MTAVGVVGLGNMGAAIAERLLGAGHDVHGTDRTTARARPLIDRGLTWHQRPRDLAGEVDVVISMVTDDAALAAITGGQDGILAGLTAGSVYIDMSSVSPSASVAVAERVLAAGSRMLDAPVSGSVPQVQSGQLAIMVGGDADTFHRAEPLLRHLGTTVTHVGGNGKGVLLKLAINISLAVQTLAFSEGLLLAERGGIDATLVAQVMSSSSIGSPMLKSRVPLLLDLPDEAWFAIRLMRKDIQLALDEGQRLGVPLTAAPAAANALRWASDLGYADRDLAALHQALIEISEKAGSAA